MKSFMKMTKTSVLNKVPKFTVRCISGHGGSQLSSRHLFQVAKTCNLDGQINLDKFMTNVKTRASCCLKGIDKVCFPKNSNMSVQSPVWPGL